MQTQQTWCLFCCCTVLRAQSYLHSVPVDHTLCLHRLSQIYCKAHCNSTPSRAASRKACSFPPVPAQGAAGVNQDKCPAEQHTGSGRALMGGMDQVGLGAELNQRWWHQPYPIPLPRPDPLTWIHLDLHKQFYKHRVDLLLWLEHSAQCMHNSPVRCNANRTSTTASVQGICTGLGCPSEQFPVQTQYHAAMLH